MSFNRAQFLIEVLGADAARALAKAASRSEHLAQMIVPRTILAMLEATPAYAGTVPGFDECSLSYSKSEKGFTGNVTLGEDFYKFEAANIFHVAGAISTAMGLDTLMFTTGRNTELQRLGKSIDLMAKAHWVGEELTKAKWPPGSGSPHQETTREPIGHRYVDSDVDIAGSAGDKCKGPGTECHEHDPCSACVAAHDKKLEKKAMGEGSGKSAGPVAPSAPAAPTATAAAPTTKQNLPKAPPSAGLPKPPKPVTSSTVKLTRSEQSRPCTACGLKQFSADHKFVGCLCFRALAKSVDWVDRMEYAELHFGKDWDRETIVTFLESVGRK
jgi:hypothetical protein